MNKMIDFYFLENDWVFFLYICDFILFGIFLRINEVFFNFK